MSTPNDLAALAAAVRNMGDQASQSIHGFYKEVRRQVKSWDERKGLGMRPATVSLASAFTSGTSATVTWKVPEDVDFVVHEIRGYFLSSDWSSEPVLAVAGLNSAVAAGPLYTTPPTERIKLLASNAKVNLTNNDNKLAITEELDLPLAQILLECGGQPLKFVGDGRPGWIIPHGTTISVKVTLGTAQGNLVDADSRSYGVTLAGVYLTRPQ